MILLLDTSTPVCRVTLLTDDGDEQSYTEWEASRQLARGLHAFIRDCLSAQDKTIHDLTGIAVFRGPGSFTGLRIGITVVNTFADSLTIPIVGTTGDSWKHEAINRLLAGENDTLVLPEYGGEANITKPRK